MDSLSESRNKVLKNLLLSRSAEVTFEKVPYRLVPRNQWFEFSLLLSNGVHAEGLESDFRAGTRDIHQHSLTFGFGHLEESVYVNRFRSNFSLACGSV